jgi:hypothetical protein
VIQYHVAQGIKTRKDLDQRIQSGDLLDVIANASRAIEKISAGEIASRAIRAARGSVDPLFTVLKVELARETDEILRYRPCSPDEMVQVTNLARNRGIGEVLRDLAADVQVADKAMATLGVVDTPWGPEDDEELLWAQETWKV